MQKHLLVFLVTCALCSFSHAQETANGNSTITNDTLPLNMENVSKSPGDTYFAQAMSLVNKEDVKREDLFYLFKQAADKGNCMANGYVGQMYLAGEGTEKNYTEAIRYFHQGSSCKDLQSLFALGYCFELGIGTAVNLEYAKNLYESAAIKDYAPAQFSLAMLLLKDESTKKQAYDWIQKAAKKRYKPAVDYYYQNVYNNKSEETLDDIFKNP